jgi:hypothetical protein
VCPLTAKIVQVQEVCGGDERIYRRRRSSVLVAPPAERETNSNSNCGKRLAEHKNEKKEIKTKNQTVKTIKTSKQGFKKSPSSQR